MEDVLKYAVIEEDVLKYAVLLEEDSTKVHCFMGKCVIFLYFTSCVKMSHVMWRSTEGGGATPHIGFSH